jgi:2-hydroxychromene-2-carboxylate isomerase
MPTTDLPEIEFWFDFGSNYSYISAWRIEGLAASRGLRVRWRPFLLGPIFKSFGWSSSPFVLQKAKGEYMWKDMVRECRKAGVAWRRPSVFPRAAVLPLRIALFGAEAPWIGEFCRRVMALNFAQDRDIDDVPAMVDVLEQLGLDAETVLQGATSDANKLALRRQTALAADRGLFGAPTFFAGSEMFWGNDRLEDALAECERAAAAADQASDA